MPDREPPAEAIGSAAFARLMADFDVQPAERVAVAVSGGADSLALALLLADWARARRIQLVALTVDHGLRDGSDHEARQVGAWLRDQGVDHHLLTWQGALGSAPGGAAGSGMQARARQARYGLMADWCRARGIRQLFVAHHLGDQAETFIMRLKRASTLYGLAAMAAQRELFGLQVCRPLLAVPKTRLEATLTHRGQAWVDDPSNTNRAFERVRTRALVAALADEGVTPAHLAGAARAAGRITEILDRAVRAFEASAGLSRQGAGCAVDAGAFRALPQVLRERVMSRLLHRVGGQAYAPSPAKLARLCAWMGSHDAGDRARTLGGCVVRRGKRAFSIAPEPPRKDCLTAGNAGFFATRPLPQAGKRLTSQSTGEVSAHTKC